MSYENYDLQENDPYLIAGSTCLLNSLGILDTQLLNEAEKDISAAAYAELILSPVPPTFDMAHLRQIHKRLFGDIYPWAGEVRTTEIAKGNKLFLPYRLVASTLEAVFEELRQEAFLKGLPPLSFAQRAGYYLGRINAIHPFREGNGRTQRILIDQLAELSGYAFQWDAISGEQMAAACRQARMDDPDFTALERLLQLHIIDL